MRDCWLVHPDPDARQLWAEALPLLQVRSQLEPCPGACVLILGSSELLLEAKSVAAGVPLVVISSQEPEQFYASGARSVIREPQTAEQCQAVAAFWSQHNLV